MKPEILAILAIYGLFIIAEIIFTRFFNKPAQVPGDGIVESTSTAVLLLVTQPFIIATTMLTTASTRLTESPTTKATMATCCFSGMYCSAPPKLPDNTRKNSAWKTCPTLQSLSNCYGR